MQATTVDPYLCATHPGARCLAGEPSDVCEPADPEAYAEAEGDLGWTGPELSPEEEAHYAAWAAEEKAIECGHAMRLHRCYLCALDAGHQGLPSDSDGPLRGVLRERTVDAADPTVAYVLTPCGHTVIDL